MTKFFGTITTVLAFFFFTGLNAQNNWYIDQQNGSNSNNGHSPVNALKSLDYILDNNLLQPGDTVFIMGRYNNPSYDPDFTYGGNSDRNNPHIWNRENTLKIYNVNGTKNKFITFKPYDENTILKGDGICILRIMNSSYLNIEGFNIYGEVENIPLSEAEGLETDGMQFLYLDSNTVDILHPALDEVLFRVEVGTTIEEIWNMTFPIIGQVYRPTYIDTKGIYITNSHHLNIVNNTIQFTPGCGLRIVESAYINVKGNDIHDCTRRSYSGTHALVITKSIPYTPESNDDPVYTIKVSGNKVHNNYNEIFSWVGTKPFIKPVIDEGKGISLQRNDYDSWQSSGQRILVENNICYWNGYSGVHSNDGYHIDFFNNTCYMNSYTNTVTYADGDQSGQNIGISTQRGHDIRICNNISVIDTDWGGYAISSSSSTDVIVSHNIIYGVNGIPNQDDDVVPIQENTIVADPLFVDATGNNFNIKSNSPAVNAAAAQYAPATDYYDFVRDTLPDIGAIEFHVTSVKENKNISSIIVYPNPFTDYITITNKRAKKETISIYNIEGNNVSSDVKIIKTNGHISINTSKLTSGIYLLKVNNSTETIIKR